jgi:hypothetical protein
MAMNNAYNPSSEGLMGTPVAQDIDQLADTYANKPEYLNQQYKVTQELKYLLAAQKVAGLLAEADKQLTASMAQQPSTVAQDMEQELLGRVQKMAGDGQDPRGKAQQVGGVLANKQQQQQKNMQRAAQGQGQPQRPQGQPQGRPMMAGGGLLSQRAPNLERMYGGGIVGFSGETGSVVQGYFDGGAVAKKLGISLEELERRIADQESRGLPREKAEQAMEQAAAVPSARKDFSMAEAYRQKLGIPEKKVEVEEEKEFTGTTKLPESPMLGNVKGAPKGLAALTPGANLPAGLPPIDDRTKKIFEGLPEEKIEEPLPPTPKPELEAAGVVDTAKSAKMLGAAEDTLKKVGGADVDTAFGRGSERAERGLASIKDSQRQKDLYGEQEGIAKEYSRRNRSEGEKSFERFLAGAAGGSGRAWTTGAGMKAGMDAQEASDYARDKDLLGTLKGITDTDLARQLDIEQTVLASGESLEGREMERQSKALAAEVSLYQTLNAEERTIYKAENDQKIAKYNSEVKQIADAQRNAIASRANELSAAFNTARLQAMDTKQRQTLLQKNVQFMAEQEAELSKRIIELSTDMQNLSSLKSIAEANKSTVEDELKIQAESLRVALASELAKVAAFNEQLQSGGDDFTGFKNVTGSS